MKNLIHKYLYLVRVPKLLFRSIFLFWIFFMLGTESVNSQEFPHEEIIAAYIFNFAQNIEWLNVEDIDRFHFKIITGNKKMIEELDKMSLKKKIRNKSAMVIAEEELIHTDNVQLIFVPKDKEELIPQIYDKIEGKNILLISEDYANKKIVMINFYETQDQSIEFEINKANIINQGLRVLPEIVLLGGTEIDVAALYRESQTSLRTLQKQLQALQQSEKELKKKIETSKLEITRQQNLINSQSAAIDLQKKELAKQKAELQELISDIKLKQDILTKQADIITQREKELSNQKEEIARREKVLTEQNEKIDSQNVEIERQTKSLEKQGATISTQKNILYLLIIIALLGIGLSISVYMGYKDKKIINNRLIKEIEERKKVEEELGKSEDLYNNAPCGYHSIDKNGVFVQINDTELKWLGYQREEVVGKMKFTDILENKSLKIFEKNFSRFKESCVVDDFEFELICKDGSVMPILHSATAITNGNGNYLMSRSIIFDISERKRTEQNIALMNFALNHVNETAFLINEDAKFHYVNKEACEVLGYTEEELLNLSVFDVDSDIPISSWQNHWNEIKNKRSIIFESHHKTKDGRIFPVEINANYFEYDGKGYNLALARDITARKQAEKALKEQMDEINRFNKLMVRREEKMIELKKEINSLLEKEGIPRKYNV